MPRPFVASRICLAGSPFRVSIATAPIDSRIGREAEAREAPFAVLAEPAGDVERHDDAIALFDPVDGATDLDDFAEVFMTEDFPGLEAGPPFVHAEIQAADVSRGQPDEDVGRLLDAGIVLMDTSRRPL